MGRFMRVFVMFDLPILTADERRNYRKFRKFLIKNGFVMLQESVYAKLTLNVTAARTVMDNIKRNTPEKGLVQILMVTEKQFSAMEYVCGEFSSEYVISTDRLVII